MEIVQPPVKVTLFAVVATAAPLPTNVYDNGNGGQGATITATVAGVWTVDGHPLVPGDTVLVKDEGTAANNGLYVCATSGAGLNTVLVRSALMQSSGQFPEAFVPIGGSGSTLANTAWICNNSPQTPPVVGTTAITFGEVQGGGGGGGVPVPATAGLTAMSDVGLTFEWEQAEFNVLAFGADPTGNVSSLSAFNTAIAAARATPRGGGTLYVPTGLYAIDGDLSALSNVSMRGESGTQLSFTNQSGHCLQVGGSTIADLSMQRQGSGLALINLGGGVLSNVQIAGQGGSDAPAILLTGGPSVVTDCFIEQIVLETGNKGLIEFSSSWSGVADTRLRGIVVSGVDVIADPTMAIVYVTAAVNGVFSFTDIMVVPNCNFNYGFYLEAGTTDHYVVVDNDFSGAITAPVFDGGTGIHKLVNDNPLRVGLGGGTVTSVTAADATITVTGSPTVNPSIAVTPGTFVGVRNPPRTTTTNDDMFASDALLRVDTTAGNLTITLHHTGAGNGQPLSVKKISADANTVTVVDESAQPIDGAANQVLSALNQSVTMLYDFTGSEWSII